MATTGMFTFTVTAGTPSAVTAGGVTPPDGTYQIEVVTDNNGTALSVVTPVGTIEQSGFPRGDQFDS